MRCLLLVLAFACRAPADGAALLLWREGALPDAPVARLALRDEPPPGVRLPPTNARPRYVSLAGICVQVFRNEFRIDAGADRDLTGDPLRAFKKGIQTVKLVRALPGGLCPRGVRVTLHFERGEPTLGVRPLFHWAGEATLNGRAWPIAVEDTTGDFVPDRLRFGGAVAGARVQAGDRAFGYRLGSGGLVTFFAIDGAAAPDAARAAALAAARDPDVGPDAAVRAMRVLARQGDREAMLAALRLAGAHAAPSDVARELGRARDADAVKELIAGLGAPDPRLRRLAVAALRHVPGTRVDEALYRRLDREKDADVREALAAATADRTDPRQVPALVRAGDIERLVEIRARDALLTILAKGEWTERVRALDRAPRDLAYAEAAARCLRHAVWQVRLVAAEYLGRVRLPLAIGPLVAQLDRERETRVRAAIGAALHRITGENLRDFADLWRQWWDERRATFRVPALPAPRPHRPDERKTVATFYGVPVESRRVVFVIDTSASMSRRDGGRSFFDTARKELLEAVGKLETEARFNVVLFGTEVWTWRKRLVPATKRGAERLRRDLAERAPRGSTYLYDGLEAALLVDDVDTVYLLSDGSPSGGKFVAAGDILREVARLNRVRRVAIHCIAIGHDSNLLERLAAAHTGTYVRK